MTPYTRGRKNLRETKREFSKRREGVMQPPQVQNYGRRGEKKDALGSRGEKNKAKTGLWRRLHGLIRLTVATDGRIEGAAVNYIFSLVAVKVHSIRVRTTKILSSLAAAARSDICNFASPPIPFYSFSLLQKISGLSFLLAPALFPPLVVAPISPAPGETGRKGGG